MSLREWSKVVSNSTAKEVELGEGWGRPMERAGKWVEEEKREEKEEVELVWGSRKERVKG